MHADTGALPFEPAGAAWRQQALRVIQRTPDASLTSQPTGIAALLRGRTFAQHGLLGDPHSLVLAFAVENRGEGSAPLVEVSVSFAVPGAVFASDGSVTAAWLEGGQQWSPAVGRIGDTAQVGLSHRGTLMGGESLGGAFRIRLRPGTDLSLTPIEVTASGYAQMPDRPVTPSALALNVERLEF